jgi:hypothetical protein
VQAASAHIEGLQNNHIPVSALWRYEKESATISGPHAEHLKECQHCVAVLIICHSCKSLADVEMKLKEHGVYR